MKNKKSTIGSTLTWIVATFIICFILVFFFIFLAINAPSEKKESISLNYGYSKLIMMQGLINFLESDNNGDTNAALIEKLADSNEKADYETLKKNVQTYFKEDSLCYGFAINSKNKNIVPEEEGFNNNPARAMTTQTNLDVQNKGVSLYLVSPSGELIKLRFYNGVC
jgi:hypothetical protein